MARKASHLSEVYTGAPVAPTTDADTQLPSPPPPSPCLSPSSVHSASDDQPSSHPTDMLPMTPLTPHGELSEMTKELLSFWEEIEPTNSNESLKLITAYQPDNKWFLNINVDLLTDDDDLINSINSMGGSNNTNSSGVRPQSSVELNSQRESEEMLLWSSLPSPPPLVPVTARLRSSRSIHARPTKLSLSPKFITWSTKTLVKRQKSNSPPNSGKSKDDATSGDKSELLNQVGRGRSKSVSTTKEMSTMVSDHRGHQPDSTVNKLSDMFALKKDQSDSAGLKPIIVQPDAFPDGNGIVFKKKSVLKRIFSGRKNRQHPESNTRYNNNNSDCYMRERSESAPVDFSDNAPIRPDPLAEISNYERIMRSNSKQRFNKARWSVQGSGLDVRDYQTILLPSEAAQLRRDYLVKKIRETK
ncbi:hypothetical protein BDF19DRAFT_425636 [Syncephalis fuscata]|nr:hypothetical protein BDF19DRAFT_425636 [Syncephalis fuscata]